jgi:quercetin dioxygenase-like cupin family protein
MHFFGTFDEKALAYPAYRNHSEGYSCYSLVDSTIGSVHTGLSLNQLQPGGTIAPHVHSYEEGFYILEGNVVVAINDHAHLLGPGDFGVTKVGTLHAWRNTGSARVRWLQMCAPQPKPIGQEPDTFFLRGGQGPTDAKPLDVRDLNGCLLGHFDPSQIPPPDQRQTAAPGLDGVFLKWMIDEHLGARHHRMLYIEYQPGVSIGLHDHTFEEAYFVLSGEVEVTLDGKRYSAKAGDFFWTGVGCTHSAANVSGRPARWLETFSPQPPAEDVFRFVAEWDKRGKELDR